VSNDADDMAEFNSIVSGGNSSRASSKYKGEDAQMTVSVSEGKNDVAVTKNHKMWAVYGDQNYSACERAVETMPPGQYTIRTSEQLGVYFHHVDTNLDDLIELPDSVSEEVISEIEIFWTKEQHFRRLGFLWKRGILTWGPPGSGKTSCLQIVSKRAVERGGIVVYVENPKIAAAGLQVLRTIEPTRPILVMLEDIDSILDQYGEPTLLALMDGELQIDNVVFVATTNYPERIDKRFINRPSRFDLVKKIGMPNEASRELFLKTKNPRLAQAEFVDELNRWVAITNGFSIAHMKELIVSVEVFEVALESAAKRLRTMMDNRPSSSENERAMGFA